MPAFVQAYDDRRPFVQHSLKTDDPSTALKRRDAFDQANEAYWADLVRKDEGGFLRYKAAVSLALTIGHSYSPEAKLARSISTGGILDRLEKVQSHGHDSQTGVALLGYADRPVFNNSQVY
ncbi:MAG: hypothetical protein GY761_13625 [Hyphomicrobiales bacterium]|nr:hypothetical protein [Hyphomicrobiales bacterium]